MNNTYTPWNHSLVEFVSNSMDDVLMARNLEELGDPFFGHCPIWMYPVQFILMTRGTVGESDTDFATR